MKLLFTVKAMLFVTLLGMAASSKIISWVCGHEVTMQTIAPWWVLVLVIEDRCGRFFKVDAREDLCRGH